MSLDAIKKPTARAQTVLKQPLQADKSAQQPQQPSQPKPYSPEMKVWLSVVGSSLVIVGVWIATFSLPQPRHKQNDSSSSELKTILTELRNTLETGLDSMKEQRATIAGNATTSKSILSNDELTELARQLTLTTHATTTASSTPFTLQPSQTSTTTPKLP